MTIAPNLFHAARACFDAGYRAKAKLLLIPLLQTAAEPATIVLYLACCDTIDETEPLKTFLAGDFADLWRRSRALRKTAAAEPPAEDSGSYRNSIWTLGALPIDTVGFNQMGGLTKDDRRTFAERKR